MLEPSCFAFQQKTLLTTWAAFQIYNLIAREDAQASLELARNSVEIAQRAKEDSSAMKTVAIMTMAFLPATFFAALFAMPTLQWDSSPVVQSNFWVYIVFTIPSTLLVFAIWGGVTQRAVIKHLMSLVLARGKQKVDEELSTKPGASQTGAPISVS